MHIKRRTLVDFIILNQESGPLAFFDGMNVANDAGDCVDIWPASGNFEHTFFKIRKLVNAGCHIPIKRLDAQGCFKVLIVSNADINKRHDSFEECLGCFRGPHFFTKVHVTNNRDVVIGTILAGSKNGRLLF